MPKDQSSNEHNAFNEGFASTGTMLEAQRAVAANSARMATAACEFAMSVNRAWMEVMNSHMDEYLQLPRRFAKAQTQFVEQAFDHYREGMQQVGYLTAQAGSEALEGMRRVSATGERMSQQARSDMRDMSRNARPKENPSHKPGETVSPGAH